MPKTSRPRRRQAMTLDGSSSSSDDSVPYAMPTSRKKATASHSRHTPSKQSTVRSDPVSSKRTSSSSSLSSSSSSSALKIRPASQSQRSPTVRSKKWAPRNSPSSSSGSSSLHERAATPPSVNTKTSRVVIDDSSDDSSSDSEEESSVVDTIRPASRRRLAVSSHGRVSSSTSRVPSSAVTPVAVPKKTKQAPRRRVIRVNLSPDRSGHALPGYKTKSQLLDLAEKHGGKALQYRVTYHMSSKPIQDYNAGATRKIRTNELVVKCNFASTNGNYGGNSFSFMNWKLPGSLSKSGKADTIYDSTRPRLFESKRKETSNPVILLCEELKEPDRRMAERFLCQAQAGSTPKAFYSNSGGSNTAAQAQESDKVATESVEEESTEDAYPVTQDDDNEEDEEFAQDSYPVTQDDNVDTEFCDGDDEEIVSEPVPTKRKRDSKEGPSSRRQKRPSPPNRTDRSEKSNKRKRQGNDTRDKPAKRVKKTYGGARHRRKKKVTFQVGGDDDSSPQFFALVEGVPGENANSGGAPGDVARDYIRDIYMNSRVEKLPTSGRMMELNGSAKFGLWTGEVVDTSGYRSASIMREKLGNLKGVRISLRHESTKSVGPLKYSRRNETPSPLSHSDESSNGTERSKGSRALTVSLIDSSQSRSNSLVAQGIVSKDVIGGRTEPFIGSISIACFDGFTSFADANVSARKVTRPLLEACRKHAIDTIAKDWGDVSFLRDLLPIPGTNNESHNVGVSFVCQVGINETYGLLVAHDASGSIVALDVVFDESIVDGRSSMSSTSTSGDVPAKLTEGMLLRHNDDMKSVAQSIDVAPSYSEEDGGVVIDDEHSKTSFVGSSVEDAMNVGSDKQTAERAVGLPSNNTKQEGKLDGESSYSDDHSRVSVSGSSVEYIPDTSSPVRKTLVSWSDDDWSTDSFNGDPATGRIRRQRQKATSPVTPTPKVSSGLKTDGVSHPAKKVKFRWDDDWSTDSSFDGTSAAIPSKKQDVTSRVNPGPTVASGLKNDGVSSSSKRTVRISSNGRAPATIPVKKHITNYRVAPVPKVASEPKRNVVSTITRTKGGIRDQNSGRRPFVTPTPARGNRSENSDGFTTFVEQVVDSDAISPHSRRNNQSEDDDLAFFDAIAYECELSARINHDGVRDSSSVAHSASRWPSIHDVFYGVHDETEHAECTAEDLQNMPSVGQPETTTLLSKWHECFLDLGYEDENVGDILSEDDSSSVASTVARWPSIHDVFYGAHDETEHAECMVEDLQNMPSVEQPETTTLLSKWHECFMDLGYEDENVGGAPLEVVSTRRIVTRRGKFTSVSCLFTVMFVLWQATLVPFGPALERTMLSSRPAPFSSARAEPTFHYDWTVDSSGEETLDHSGAASWFRWTN